MSPYPAASLNRIVNWQNKNGNWLFWIFRFPAETILSGAWWKYECGNGPFPQISFYSQTLRFVKSDKKTKVLITPRAQQYILMVNSTLWDDSPRLFSVFTKSIIFTLLRDDAVTEIFPSSVFLWPPLGTKPSPQLHTLAQIMPKNLKYQMFSSKTSHTISIFGTPSSEKA